MGIVPLFAAGRVGGQREVEVGASGWTYTEAMQAEDGSGPVEIARGMEIGHVFQLGRFFDGWIYGADLPQLSHETHMTGSGADQVVTVRLQQGPEVFDFAVASGAPEALPKGAAEGH